MGRAKKYSTPEESRLANIERAKKYTEDNYEQHKEKQREIYRQKHPGSKIYKKRPPKILNDLPDTNTNNLENLGQSSNI
jgi:hypothetical protein